MRSEGTCVEFLDRFIDLFILIPTIYPGWLRGFCAGHFVRENVCAMEAASCLTRVGCNCLCIIKSLSSFIYLFIFQTLRPQKRKGERLSWAPFFSFLVFSFLFFSFCFFICFARPSFTEWSFCWRDLGTRLTPSNLLSSLFLPFFNPVVDDVTGRRSIGSACRNRSRPIDSIGAIGHKLRSKKLVHFKNQENEIWSLI